MVFGGRVVVVDFGMGNLSSVQKQLRKVSDSVEVTSDPRLIASADKLVLPGVGHFSLAVRNIAAMGLLEPLREAVEIKKTPILGICLGLQLMARASEEGGASGFGWIDAEVVRFQVDDDRRFKVPHMGWNQVRRASVSRLMEGIADTDEFYFTHSYHLKVAAAGITVGETTFADTFPSAIEAENVFGVQFHPEKSRQAGIRVLRNFLSS